MAFEAATSNDLSSLIVGQPGNLHVVVSDNTPLPEGGGAFQNFSFGQLSNGVWAFQATGGAIGTTGVYTIPTSGGTPNVIADNTTAVPGGSGDFVSLSSPSLNGTRLAFYGTDASGNPGLYTSSGGTLSVLANSSSGLTIGGAPVTSFGNNVALDGTHDAFLASNSLGTALFADFGNGVHDILDTTQLLDGKTISSLIFSKNSLDGNSVGFTATFSDGSSGVFLATVVPEPGSLALGMIACGGGFFIVRRRRQTQLAG